MMMNDEWSIVLIVVVVDIINFYFFSAESQLGLCRKTIIQTPIRTNFRRQVEGNSAPICFQDNITESTVEQVIK